MKKVKNYEINTTLVGNGVMYVTSEVPPEDFDSIEDFCRQAEITDTEVYETDIDSFDSVREME